MNPIRISAFVCFMFGLQGCVGSKIRLNDQGVDEAFPSLHDVPERPKEQLVSDQKSKPEKKAPVKDAQQKALTQNKNLRQQFGL